MKRPNNEQIEKTGSLKYLANDKIAAHFPDNECIIIKGNRTKIKLGIFNGTYRNDRNPIFKPISRMLLYAISGQCQTLAEENNYNLALTEEPSSYTINLTTKKKKIIGYRQAVFKYSKDDKRLKSILLIDFKDNHNLFYFENQVFDKGIEESAFNL